MRKLPVGFLLLFVIAAPNAPAQTTADPQLTAAIAKIKAIDNHAHPLRYVGPGEKPDDEFDALPLDAIGPIPLPVRLNKRKPLSTKELSSVQTKTAFRLRHAGGA